MKKQNPKELRNNPYSVSANIDFKKSKEICDLLFKVSVNVHLQKLKRL